MDSSLVYQFIHVLSLPLTFILMLVYKDHKNHPTIACYSGTLFLSSLVSSLIGFIRLIQNSKSEQNIICSLQAVLMIYVMLASDIWPVCIAFNVWVQFSSNSLQGRDRWSIRMLLFVYAIMSWGVPVFLTLAASIKPIMNGDMIPWPNYCMPTPSGILAAIFFIGAAAIITTLAFSDCLIHFNFVVFFGTTSEAARKYLPKCCFSYKNKNNVLVRPSMINRSLRKSTTTPSLTSREHSLDDPNVVTEEKSSPQTPQSNFVMPGGSSVSTFSQRMNPNSPDPFSHRKNPSLTIKIDPIRPASDSKMANSKVSYVRKGKERATAIKKSLLHKTYADDSNDDYSYLNVLSYGPKNQDSSKNKKVHVSRGKSSAFYETAMPNRRSPRQMRHTITEGNKTQSRDISDEPVRHLLKQFSFEKRHKSESILKLPSEFGIKTHSHHSLLSLKREIDNHVENVMSSSTTSQIIVTGDSQSIISLPQPLSSLMPQTGLSAPPHKSSKESIKKETINYPPNFYLTVNNGSSSSTNATFGSPITSKPMVTGIVNSTLDQNHSAENSNNLLFRPPPLRLPSTPSFGTMAVRSTKSRTNTQSSSSSKSSKTSSNNRSSAGTTRSSNGFTLTPRGSHPFNTTRPVTSNDNGSSLAFGDENEERMGELRQIVEEFDQASFKTQNSSQ
ncbi:12170_t:CDS:2 [Cetraspora pellucida]|uniref:12170_t:CDS:1 n=1 Tax=Cetraspora pellucida TaxID=1433469 RepID=A0A9N9C6J3_9GLOM|nr:12170_t:CDS:2 [Cetraspora pellucida]